MGGHEIYNFLSLYPTDATYQIWLRLAQYCWEDVYAQRTMDDDGRQPKAIGHLSDSGDLKIEMILTYGFDFHFILLTGKGSEKSMRRVRQIRNMRYQLQMKWIKDWKKTNW